MEESACVEMERKRERRRKRERKRTFRKLNSDFFSGRVRVDRRDDASLSPRRPEKTSEIQVVPRDDYDSVFPRSFSDSPLDEDLRELMSAILRSFGSEGLGGDGVDEPDLAGWV